MFDIIVSQWCIEHLTDPAAFFREVARTLKDGGHFIFCTPNLYGCVGFLSRITPLALHRALNKLLLNIKEQDTFPTFYRANTVKNLDKQLAEYGLARKCLKMYDEPPWLWSFSPFMCRLALAYRSKMMRDERLGCLRGIIFAVYQKNDKVSSVDHPCRHSRDGMSGVGGR